MDAFHLILQCCLDIIVMILVVLGFALAWYFGYTAGWRDCNTNKKKVRRELRKLERYY